MSAFDQLLADAEQNPDDPHAWCRFAQALADDGRAEQAREALKRARAIPSTDPFDWVEIAGIHETLDEPQLAAGAYRKAVQLDRQCVEAYCALGALLIRTGETRAAVLTLKVAVSYSPDSADLRLVYARALELSDQLAEAKSEASRAALIRPDHAGAHRILARIYEREGNFEEEQEALRTVVMLDPTDYESLAILARRLSELDRRDQAIDTLTGALEGGALDFEAHIALGIAMSELGLSGLAIRCLREAIRIKPNVASPHLELGLAYSAAGDLREAVVSFRTAALIEPSSASAHYHLGLALRKSGDIREAANALVKAAAIAPEDTNIQQALNEAMSEKAELKKNPLLRAQSGAEGPMGSFGGDLSIFALPEMLEFLSNRKTSGMLQIVSRHGEGTIELYKGQIVRVSSPRKKRLARILEEDDVVEATEVKRALEGWAEHDDDTVVGEKLIARQVVERKAVHEALTKQVRAGLAELVGWNEGEVTFHAANAKPGEEKVEPDFAVDAKWLLFEVMAEDREA